ncbi:MAG: 1-phosphofructokinase, partial [Anaerolineae bacterium]|nr:1-phosphofructokinase [Anaerolineae bacterium]
MNNIYTLTLNPAIDRELTVPAIEFGSVLRASAWQVDFGGKGFNVSRMLKSLGTVSTALGFAGGKSGELLKDGLEALGIGTDFVWVDGETRTNVSIVTEAHDRYVKVNEPGPTISTSEQQALIEKVHQLSQPDDWWVLAGSLPPGIASDFYAHLIEIIQNTGARALLDTSGEALSQGST